MPAPDAPKDGFTLDEVMEWRKRPDSQEYVLARSRPYMRLSAAGQGPVFIQQGKLYTEAGVELADFPDWVVPLLDTLTPASLAAVGWLRE